MQIQCLVKPKSKMDGISIAPDGTLRVKIKAMPVSGEANEYLIKYLARVFNLSPSCIRIISGFTSSHKRVNIVAEEASVKAMLDKL